MRALATPFRAGLAAAAVVLLAACGGSDADQPEAASTASSSSSASSSTTTSDEDVQAFCTEAEVVLTSASESLEAADPTQLGPTLEQAVAELEQLDPPAEISADWDIATQTFAGLRDAVDGVDLTTPEGQASVQEAVAELEGQATESQARLDTWITENCDNA